MSDIIDGQKLEADILKDMRVELTDEFDKNFQLSARADGGPAGRSGSGRRGGSRSSIPRQVR